MRTSILIITLISLIGFCNAQEKVVVEGAISIANSESQTPAPGTIRWTGIDFEGWTGSKWLSLTLCNEHADSISSTQLYFLGSDQSDNYIRLFSDTSNILYVLTEPSIWKFLPNRRPTDAKRVDQQNEISVLIATHGSIYQVPYNYEDKYIYADTYASCHSVEILPDGNMISASSNHNKLTLHFNKQEETDRYIFIESFDLPFVDAHGVVYDKQRDIIWALGTTLGKFKYNCCPNPHLIQIADYPLPTPHADGHDLFPDENGDLLATTDQGVIKYSIDTSENPIYQGDVYLENSIKSVVTNITNGDLFITSPVDIPGSESWQTNRIINLTQSTHFIRPDAKFYKVRLWQKNSFSYD